MQAAKSAPDAQQTKPEVSVRLAHGPEIFLFYIADFICAYPLFIKVT